MADSPFINASYSNSPLTARAAFGETSAEEAVAQARERIEEIFASWRERGRGEG